VAAAPALGLETDAAAAVGAAPAMDLRGPAAAPALDLPTAATATPTLALNVPASRATPALDFLATSALDLANAAAAAAATTNGRLLTSGSAAILVYAARLFHTASPADVAGLTLGSDTLDAASFA
jgi:hypothetical protein